MTLIRQQKNPILSPGVEKWENYATFNPSVVKVGDKYVMLYRAMGDEEDYEGTRVRMSSIGICESDDGVNFVNRRQFIKPEFEWEKFGCEDPRVTKIGDEYFIFYTALGDYPLSPNNIKVGLAITRDFVNITEKRLVTPFNAKAMALFPEKIDGKYTAILSVNTDLPPSKIAIVQMENKEQLWDQNFWREWYSRVGEHEIVLRRMKHDHVETGAQPVLIDDGWLVIYSYISDYGSDRTRFGIEAVVLDKENPKKIVGITEQALLIPETNYEMEGQINKVVFPSGALVEQGVVGIYYGAADSYCCLASASLLDVRRQIKIHKHGVPKLLRVAGPIITPESSHSWESKATFNPAAIYLDDQVHVIYRAMSEDNTSVFGYASSRDGMHIDVRLDEPIYIPKIDAEMKRKPNANSGCEDPRVVRLDDTIYMTYTAYDGMNPPRVALTSIKVDDFLRKEWRWENPQLISAPNFDNKNACILPEKINGKYVIFHRLENNIHIDYVDDLIFEKDEYLTGQFEIPVRAESWDAVRIGISAPPIRTNLGWLLLYHGISKVHYEYRVGAMLLDLKDPTIVLGRTPFALLEPEMDYEKLGLVQNVVFPCGAVIMGGNLLVYYGGGDRVVGVASIKFDVLMDYMEELKNPRFLA